MKMYLSNISTFTVMTMSLVFNEV